MHAGVLHSIPFCPNLVAEMAAWIYHVYHYLSVTNDNSKQKKQKKEEKSLILTVPYSCWDMFTLLKTMVYDQT